MDSRAKKVEFKTSSTSLLRVKDLQLASELHQLFKYELPRSPSPGELGGYPIFKYLTTKEVCIPCLTHIGNSVVICMFS